MFNDRTEKALALLNKVEFYSNELKSIMIEFHHLNKEGYEDGHENISISKIASYRDQKHDLSQNYWRPGEKKNDINDGECIRHLKQIQRMTKKFKTALEKMREIVNENKTLEK